MKSRNKPSKPDPSVLVNSDEINRRIIEAMRGGLVVVSPEGAILQANAEAQRILGLSFDEITKLYVSHFEHRTIYEDGTECKVEDYPVSKCLKTGREQGGLTLGVLRPDNEISWAVFNAAPVFDPATAKLRAVVVTFLDITERKRTEQALKASEQRLESILRHTPNVAVEACDRDGRVIYWNKAAETIFGWRADEAIGRTLDQLMLDPKAAAEFVETLRSLENSETLLPPSEWKFKNRAGKEGVLYSSIFAIPAVNGGKEFICMDVDISERLRAEVALRESEERFAAFMDNNPAVAWMKDSNWKYAYINKTFSLRFNLSLQAILGKTDFDMFPHEVASALRANDEKVKATGEMLETYENVPTPDGAMRYWMVLKFPFQDAAGVRYVAGMAIDITERQKNEQERQLLERRLLETQKLESLGVLAGGIAHDFNNLLAAVLGNVSLAAMHIAPDNQARTYLSSIETTTHRAAELCKQMLAYSGRGRFLVQPVKMNQLIEEMADLLRISIGKGIALKLNLARELPEVSADATQIRQVVMNLILNASEAIGDAQGAISISTARKKLSSAEVTGHAASSNLRPGCYVAVEVADSGCGMDEQTRSRIFDPFFTTKFTGRGLGLAAVLGIIRGHNGTIQVESEPGRGTVFKLLIPCL